MGTSYSEDNNLYRYKIQVELIVNHKLSGFSEPLIESKYPLFNRKIIESSKVKIIDD